MTSSILGFPLYRSVPFAVGFDLLERWRFEREAEALLSRDLDNSFSLMATDRIDNRRNVHMFVMESLMDPSILGIPLAVDPIDARFRRRIGGSAVAPVLVGRSAQSEVDPDAIIVVAGRKGQTVEPRSITAVRSSATANK